ncbi:MAG: helix-hairpin-helix domain-containing protein [Bacilli bacterium]|nr:helix-hairpin-helix domain-containing protein [Bacilli bacterium]
MFKAIIAVVIGAVVLIVVLTSVEKATTDDPGGGGGTTEVTTLTVSIEGQVNKEGTYYINSGSTLSDLIDAAGGVTGNADSRAYNLDYELKNNLNFYIAPIYDTSETCAQVEITKYNVNSASSEELQKINGITSYIASGIVAYRNGTPFRRIEDLINVDRIGASTLSKIRNYVTLK